MHCQCFPEAAYAGLTAKSSSPQLPGWPSDLTWSARRIEAAVSNSNPHASQDQELRMDRSLTYFEDVAAIKVSLQLMQKRSGVPHLRFTSTFEVPPFETLYARVPTCMLDVKPM